MLERARHYASACLATLIGTAAVFSILVVINAPGRSPKPDQTESQTKFTVERPVIKPKPTAQEVVRDPGPQRASASPAPPAFAGLDAAIGSVDIPLPGFDLSALNRLDGSLGADKDLVMTEETADTGPQALSQQPVVYPADAKLEGIEGYVVLSLLIGADGGIQEIKVLESQPPGAFDEAAIQGIYQWEFAPAEYQGKPVTVWARQTIRFDLS